MVVKRSTQPPHLDLGNTQIPPDEIGSIQTHVDMSKEYTRRAVICAMTFTCYQALRHLVGGIPGAEQVAVHFGCGG